MQQNQLLVALVLMYSDTQTLGQLYSLGFHLLDQKSKMAKGWNSKLNEQTFELSTSLNSITENLKTLSISNFKDSVICDLVKDY